MAVQSKQATEPATNNTFSFGRTLRLSSFQIGSAMGEILTASVWNRIMITDLGLPATPVGILLALQYLLIPITLWAGHMSDTKSLFGMRRTGYIWMGRLLVVVAFPFLGLSIQQFEAGANSTGWAIATVAFLLFGVGKLLSGSVYLALVRDSAPPSKQGLAIGLAETTLIAFFPIMAIAFGRWMEQYDPAIFWQLIIATSVVGGFFWWFATVRIEQAIPESNLPKRSRLTADNFGRTIRTIWADDRTRAFFIFLALATFAAWMQDNVLEPFGGDVFSLDAGSTTRFTGYWGTMTLLVAVACFVLLRKQRPENQRGVTSIGLWIMALGMLLLVVTSALSQQALLTTSLIVFGLGFGLYTFGGLSLMAAMSPTGRAGAYLGLWTACILLSKGAGTLLGGVLRDIFLLQMGLSAGISYALVFAVAGVGLFVAGFLVRHVDVAGFVADKHAPFER